MIYNWTKYDMNFEAVDPKTAISLAPAGWKPAEREYFKVQVTNLELLDQAGAYVHPAPEDVFVTGEHSYGLDHVVKSTRRGARWEFVLLLHKLVKSVYGPTKSFGAPYKA